MDFGIKYNQLRLVANLVRAGIVSYDRDNAEHGINLRKAIPQFLGKLGDVHGESYPTHHLDAVIDVINAKEIEVDFFLVGLDACSPVMLAGLATGAHTFGAICDEYNNLIVVPMKHGEDLAVEDGISKLIRERTRCEQYPKGIGAGTIVWQEQAHVWRSYCNEAPTNHWDYEARDNEHSPKNPPILGLMDKFSAIRGTEKDSAILQLDGVTSDIERKWGVNNVKTQDLPSRANSTIRCPNNFLTRWSSDNGKQQIVVIFTKMGSTFDGQPIVWTKIKSNGILPNDIMLDEVLASLLQAGCKEIASPVRRWGAPRKKLANDLSHIFGARVPIMHIYANKEEKIVNALLRLKADRRRFGHETMVSGFVPLVNIVREPVKNVAKMTEVKALDKEPEVNTPHFKVVDEINEDVKRIVATKPDAREKHFEAVDEIGDNVRRVFATKASSVLAPN